MVSEKKHQKLISLSNEYIKEQIAKLETYPEFYDLPETTEEYEYIDYGKFVVKQQKNKNSFYWRHIYNSEKSTTIRNAYLDLLKSSYEENYYFFGCILKVAIHYFNTRIEEETNPIYGITKKDIYKEILQELHDAYNYFYKDQPKITTNLKEFKDRYYYEEDWVPYIYLGKEDGDPTSVWIREYHKKVKYLEDKINDVENERLLESTKEEKISAKQKVLYLNELGIIDFLNNDKNKKMNPTKMSKLLAKVTGEKADTLRFSIAAILDDNPTKNNPYIDEDNVDQVRSFLIKKGYNIKK